MHFRHASSSQICFNLPAIRVRNARELRATARRSVETFPCFSRLYQCNSCVLFSLPARFGDTAPRCMLFGTPAQTFKFRIKASYHVTGMWFCSFCAFCVIEGCVPTCVLHAPMYSHELFKTNELPTQHHNLESSFDVAVRAVCTVRTLTAAVTTRMCMSHCHPREPCSSPGTISPHS